MSWSWADVRDALVTALAQASGFDESRILWQGQDVDQPPLDYLSLSLGAASNPGQDGIVSSTDLTRPAGQEIKLEVIGFREVTLQIEIFTKATVSSNDQGADALAVGEQIRAALIFDSIRDRLATVGVSLCDLSAPVQYVPEVVSVGFRGRATYDVRCFVPAIAAHQYTGFIASVKGKATVRGGAVDPETWPISAP